MSTSADLVTIGLDIGGTKVLGVVLDGAGAIVREARRPSPVNELAALVAVCAEIVDELDEPGAAGRRRRRRPRRPRGPPHLRAEHPGRARGAAARRACCWRLDRPVVVDNDANVAALCEVTYGAAVGARHALMVTLGTGIGGGIIFDGKVYRGRQRVRRRDRPRHGRARRSEVRVRRARATGRRSRAATRSAAWPASSCVAGRGARRSSRRPAATSTR